MPIARIYQPVALALGTLELNEEASHHLARVLRAEINDEVILFNGEGGEYRALIRCISKKTVSVELIELISREVESPLQTILLQGIARGEKMDFIIQKAVELGVTEIYPVVTERCNVRLDKDREQKRLQHWQAVAVSATEQSGRNRLAKIHAPIALTAALKSVHADKKYVLSPHSRVSLRDETKKPVSTAILVGPEGGLSQQEIMNAVSQDFMEWNLGPRILRTESAALVALSILQFEFGDFT